MILFLAQYPGAEESNDGMAQRILAIDNLFSNSNRVYLSLSLTRHWFPEINQVGNCKIYRVQSFLGIPLAIYLGLKCRMAYIHSIYNALWILYLLPWLPFVLDLHGVVPEEEALTGNKLRAIVFGIIERLCVKCSKGVVCVTAQMGNHIQFKYPETEIKKIVLPILQPVPGQDSDFPTKGTDGPCRVIYSGGVQSWQNVDMMVSAMACASVKCVYEVYTPCVNLFQSMLDSAGVHCHVESLSTADLSLRYQRAQFGFLLRDANLVNKVACPTKLVEYMQYGVIPIVLQPEIGDMNQLGYAYLTLEDFCGGLLPDQEAIQKMRKANLATMDRWQKLFQSGADELIRLAS